MQPYYHNYYLINVNAFLIREDLIREGKEVDCRTEVIEFCNDEAKDYAILSHWWIGKEVKYEEMAQKDPQEIAELSEAINSMYGWYENSRVCSAYLHDRMYPNSNGYPEWLSRGWTPQKMIVPSGLRFFNKTWQPIGDKRTLVHTLISITGVPQHILTGRTIMSWAADWRTSQIEDRAYLLMCLLHLNMSMLYGEGKKAFQRLQMEIIHMSNNHSIFAWRCHGEDGWTGSVLADDPSLSRCCSIMKLLDHNEYIQSLRGYFPDEDLRSIEEDKFDYPESAGTGIQSYIFCDTDFQYPK
ncbi:hypothetical protein V8B97DRAFT_2025272 [Scleroderma yunnanense]